WPEITIPESHFERVAGTGMCDKSGSASGQSRLNRNYRPHKQAYANILSGLFLVLCGVLFNTGTNSGEARMIIDSDPGSSWQDDAISEKPQLKETLYGDIALEKTHALVFDEWQFNNLLIEQKHHG